MVCTNHVHNCYKQIAITVLSLHTLHMTNAAFNTLALLSYQVDRKGLYKMPQLPAIDSQ